MRLKFCFLLICIFIFGCQDETGEYDRYAVIIENQTGKSVSMFFYAIDLGGELKTEEVLIHGSIYECDYSNDSFKGIKGCYEGFSPLASRIDSIRIIFENRKGYICVMGDFFSEEDTYCINNVEFFENSDTDRFEEVSKRTYKLVLTEEDYSNAYELPE